MPYEQVKDILRRAEYFHHELAAFYERLDENVESEKVKLLLKHLREHETKLASNLSSFETSASRNVMDTWVKFPPYEHFKKLCSEACVKTNARVNDIIAMALEFDDALLSFYECAANLTTASEIEEIFENLFEEGKMERRKLVQSIFGFE